MITTADELRELREEFEELTLMADTFPKKQEFRKRADFIELLIVNIESKNEYI